MTSRSLTGRDLDGISIVEHSDKVRGRLLFFEELKGDICCKAWVLAIKNLEGTDKRRNGSVDL